MSRKNSSSARARHPVCESPDFTAVERQAVLVDLWPRIQKARGGSICNCHPDSMPSKRGNPKKLAELMADPSYGYEEVPLEELPVEAFT